MLQTILLAVHILLAMGLIGLILLQQGQGATTGAAFGSGASNTVFGARGSGSFLTRATAILAILFFANSFFLSYRSGQKLEEQSLMERVQTVPQQAAPASNAANDLPPGAAPAEDGAAVIQPPAAEIATAPPVDAATVPADVTPAATDPAPAPQPAPQTTP